MWCMQTHLLTLSIEQHGSAKCLSGKELLGFDFVSITKDKFVPMSVQSASKLGSVM
jgi:hypothetical protein